MADFTLKRGDTFQYTVPFKDADGDPITGASGKLKSQIRDPAGNLITEVDISETSTAGTYLFKVADTQDWPVDVLETDFEYTDNDVTTSSRTLFISVEKDVTHE
jgi:hypothetical protein